MRRATADGTDEPTPASREAVSRYPRVGDDDRRRLALTVLADRGTPISLDELAGAVASRSGGTEAAEDVAVALHHVHLPLLADVGLVEYDPEAARIERGAEGESRLAEGLAEADDEIA